MHLRFKIIIPLFLIVTLGCLSLAHGQNKFKLKPGASGKLCLSCHDQFQEKLKSPFVHTPVKAGDCTDCHDPHTSSHGKLLSEGPNQICFNCHDQIVPAKAKSSHKVVSEGNCVKCHDPHASEQKFVLLKSGNDLCISCHKKMGETLAKVKFRHPPVEKDCLNCHDPHGSAQSDHLLKKDLVVLCVSCHKPDRPAFAQQHMNYPVGNARCTSCHDPHGSDRGGILYANVHPPVANKACQQCHEPPSSPTPFKTRRPGYELCKGCHSAMVNETLSKNRVHWPLLDRKGCLNCHQAHASTQQKLLSSSSLTLCGECHSDTMKFQVKLAEKEAQENASAKGKVIRGALTHNPVQEGNCEACHAIHAADSVFMLKESSIVKLCQTCHDWSKHSNHPMGEKVIDPRNRNVAMQCLSCHRSHGTGYRYMIELPTVTELCVQCHKQFKR
jgi:DmsE family decaheme c-type cytochrome